jgi:hypothetical protein
VELRGIVRFLVGAGTVEGDRALWALADPKHPCHPLAKEAVLAGWGWDDRSPFFAHPFCLVILRRALEDARPTGTTYQIRGDSLVRFEGDRSFRSEDIPALLSDPAGRRSEVAERAWDLAAERLGKLVMGLPAYHPLLKDADRRLALLKAMLDRPQGRFRRLSWREMKALELSSWEARFIPDIRPLGRPATADDVRAGKAVFYLDGKGKLTNQKLPAVAVLKPDKKGAPLARLLIVQAEAGPDGETIYGGIGKEGMRSGGPRTCSALSRSGRRGRIDGGPHPRSESRLLPLFVLGTSAATGGDQGRVAANGVQWSTGHGEGFRTGQLLPY